MAFDPYFDIYSVSGPHLPEDHSDPKFTTYSPYLRCGSCRGSGLRLCEVPGNGSGVIPLICLHVGCHICPCMKGVFKLYGEDENLSKKCNVCGFIFKLDLRRALEVLRHPRTQKGKGIKALSRWAVFNRVDSYILQNENHIDLDVVSTPATLKKNFFRPCPSVPRHGFLESRQVANKEEVKKLLAETLALDPDGELVMMRKIEAKASGILVAESGMLALGPGHDGATSGKKSIMLPCTPVSLTDDISNSLSLLKLIRQHAGITENEHTYYELVYKKHYAPQTETYAVQARSGPPVKTTSADFIPRKEKVKEVIKPGKDLLAWEKLVASKKGVEGVAAYQKGATLAAHAAVHCVAAGIPFITTKCPRKGTLLVPTEEMSEISNEEFKIGIDIGWHSGVKGLYDSVRTAIAIVHNCAALRTSKYFSRLIGFAAGVIMKAGALACVGESRHRDSISQVPKVQRLKAWEMYGNYSPDWLAQKCGRLVPVFLHEGWDGSFGGPKWADCCMSVVSLYQSMVANDIEAVMQKMNIVITTCHNGGKLLNKFVLNYAFFDRAAHVPGYALADCGSDLYRVLNKKPSKDPLVLKPYIKRASKCLPEPVITEKCSSGQIQLKFTIPLKSKKTENTIYSRPIFWIPKDLTYKVINAYLESA